MLRLCVQTDRFPTLAVRFEGVSCYAPHTPPATFHKPCSENYLVLFVFFIRVSILAQKKFVFCIVDALAVSYTVLFRYHDCYGDIGIEISTLQSHRDHAPSYGILC